ncbi:hypothetical protein Acel_0038 [Acidothermus cellulolyticus 11B]|uniref:Uncharacterized protein n=2 Tax=Acidothermus cellulolyticus TaxID=28049 RepID=A0LQV4_ACIC1|nr:hypothetical protein Acel_0038 [Acidothermus cellulolyticus 11B]
METPKSLSIAVRRLARTQAKFDTRCRTGRPAICYINIMAGREMDALEIEAARVVNSFYMGRIIQRDGMKASDGSHDYDIELPDGRIIALEVTSAADPERMALLSELSKTPSIPSSLEHDWLVSVWDVRNEPHVNIKRLVKKTEPRLSTLVRHGVTEIDKVSLDRKRHVPRDVCYELASLGVARARTLTLANPGEVREIFFSYAGGVTSHQGILNQLIEQTTKANAAKLAVANAAERHLFVWVTALGRPDVELAMFSNWLPVNSPAIAPGIDVVWAATLETPGFCQQRIRRLWRVRREGPWESLPLPFGIAD